ncbi:MAG: HPF/RaiA family ribosome-associated protein [Alphaproteobacteria bacterium]
MEKPLQIAFKDMDSSAYLEGLIRARVARLERRHTGILGCRVVVEVPHRSTESGKLPLGIAVEIEVPGRNKVVAKGTEERRDAKGDHAAVVSRVFDAVDRQLEQLDDVRQGFVKAHAADSDTGVVIRLFPEEDYGFVEVRGSPDLYFSRSVVGDGAFEQMEVGNIVQVVRAAADGPMGPQASTIRLLNARRSAP